MFLMQEIPVKTALSSLYRNTQGLSMINFMICHIKLQRYNDVEGTLNVDGLIGIFLIMKLLWR